MTPDCDASTARRLLLIDDHPLFCDAMAMTVSEIFAAADIVTAANLSQAIEHLQTSASAPDIIVLDLNLPDVDAIEGLIRLRQLTPQARILVVSSISDNRVTRSVLEAGAVGFVPKNSPRHELIRAFQAISAGGIYTPEDYHAPQPGRIDQERHVVMDKVKSLTPQQARILSLVCEGKLNKQIAFELSISEATVKAHITAVLRKLGVQTRTQAGLLAKKLSFSDILEVNRPQGETGGAEGEGAWGLRALK